MPEFLHVLFSLIVKHSPDKRRAKRGEKKARGKIQDLSYKRIYAPHTHAFITCTTSTCTNNGAGNLKNGFLLFCLVEFIVHTSVFCPCFCQKQSAKQPKKYGECFTTKLKSTLKNSDTFEEKTISSEKVAYIVL